jgi:hypothetical protein
MTLTNLTHMSCNATSQISNRVLAVSLQERTVVNVKCFSDQYKTGESSKDERETKLTNKNYNTYGGRIKRRTKQLEEGEMKFRPTEPRLKLMYQAKQLSMNRRIGINTFRKVVRSMTVGISTSVTRLHKCWSMTSHTGNSSSQLGQVCGDSNPNAVWP